MYIFIYKLCILITHIFYVNFWKGGGDDDDGGGDYDGDYDDDDGGGD